MKQLCWWNLGDGIQVITAEVASLYISVRLEMFHSLKRGSCLVNIIPKFKGVVVVNTIKPRAGGSLTTGPGPGRAGLGFSVNQLPVLHVVTGCPCGLFQTRTAVSGG